MAQWNLFTHNGIFHADDVFSAALLMIANEQCRIVRGGDEDLPEDKGNWIIFDIGGGELDHHTPECRQRNGCHPGTSIPYASLGLAWRKYYTDVLDAMNCPQDYYDTVYDRFERSLILGIDAADNGVNPVSEALADMPEVQSDHEHELIAQSNIAFTITDLIRDFNPTWESDRDPDEAFLDAVSFAKDVIYNRLYSIMDSLDSKNFVLSRIQYSANHIMTMKPFAPWQGIVSSQSGHNRQAADIWYVISPALRGGWNVQCVLEDLDDKTSYRHPFPSDWYGLRGEELQRVSGVKDAKFCHPSGFLAGADSEEGAIQMAQTAIRNK